MKIGSKNIGSKNQCFIIAEMSANHGGKFSKAKEIIIKAKEAGADAVKIQTYKAETITIRSSKQDFMINKKSPWAQYDSLFKLYKNTYTPWEWQSELFQIAKENNIIMFSSPFDDSSVDFLENLNTPAYKIASPEINDIPLLRKIATTKKPVLLSTGLANYSDITLAIRTLKNNGCNDIGLLKCTSSYPAPFDEINLNTIVDYPKKFKCIPGISDHTIGDEIPIASISLGAKIIEKHFILNDEITPDSFFSMSFDEFKIMVTKIRNVEKALGSINYDYTKSMLKNINSRRSLYVSKPIKKGDVITKFNIQSIRPAFGLHPKYYDKIIGKKVKLDLQIGDRLTIDIIEI
tara:strand:+ start:1602 stop:2645 length:1044 start_codon:yes stop_codon:yes gene_type:complete